MIAMLVRAWAMIHCVHSFVVTRDAIRSIRDAKVGDRDEFDRVRNLLSRSAFDRPRLGESHHRRGLPVEVDDAALVLAVFVFPLDMAPDFHGAQY